VKISLKSNRDMKYLDKFDRIWPIYVIMSTYTAWISFYMCFRVIIWTLMMKSMRKNKYKVVLMNILLKSNRDMKYLDKFETIWPIYDILSTYTALISFYMCLRVIIWTLMMKSMRKNKYKVFLMKILLKSNRDMKYLDQFDKIWPIYDMLSTFTAWISFYICFRVIIWILMMKSMRKNKYKVFLMKILLKSNRDMKYLDKFETIWPIYDILSTYTALISFYMCYGVIIWTLMMKSMRKNIYKVVLMMILLSSNRDMKYLD
jgi:hypothetical protein